MACHVVVGGTVVDDSEATSSCSGDEFDAFSCDSSLVMVVNLSEWYIM